MTETEEAPKKKGWFSRLKEGLSRTSNKITTSITDIFTKRKIDQDTLDELEESLIQADLGVPMASRMITALSKNRVGKEVETQEICDVLSGEIQAVLEPCAVPYDISKGHKPHIILMVGVNGSGKTTTIAKLAQKWHDEGLQVSVAAGDTFRAAAIEQLSVWGERIGVPVIKKELGSDAASLAFEAVTRAREVNRHSRSLTQ